MKRLVSAIRTAPAFGHNDGKRSTHRRRINVPSSPQYRIRGIEPDVWARFIKRLEADKVRAGEFFYRAIHRYASGDTSLELPPESELRSHDTHKPKL